MSKKKGTEPLIRFVTPSSPEKQATRSMKRAVEGKRKLYVEVPESVHRAVRFKALELRTTVTEYILGLLETKKTEALGVAPFPAASRQSRLVLDLPSERADRVMSASEPFGTFRQMVCACLESDGIEFPRAIPDEQLLQAAVATGRFAADHYGKTLDEVAGRAAWVMYCRLSTKDEQYQRANENFRAFFAAATKAGKEALREE